MEIAWLINPDWLMTRPPGSGFQVLRSSPTVGGTLTVANAGAVTRELGMIELVVVACLMTGQPRCEAFHLPFLGTMELRECIAKQPVFELVRWAREHPGWTIRKWTCGPPSA